MSYKSYVLSRLKNGAVITWTEDRRRYWAWMHTGRLYEVSARMCDGDVVSAGQPRRLGQSRLNWIFDTQYVCVREPRDVPGPVAVLARCGPSAAASLEDHN